MITVKYTASQGISFIYGGRCITLNKGKNTIQLYKVDDGLKSLLDDYKSDGLLEYKIADEQKSEIKVDPVIDEQKALKSTLLKQGKEFGLNVTNFMTVEALQDAINKHLEQITDQAEPDSNNSNPQDDNAAGSNPSNS